MPATGAVEPDPYGASRIDSDRVRSDHSSPVRGLLTVDRPIRAMCTGVRRAVLEGTGGGSRHGQPERVSRWRAARRAVRNRGGRHDECGSAGWWQARGTTSAGRTSQWGTDRVGGAGDTGGEPPRIRRHRGLWHVDRRRGVLRGSGVHRRRACVRAPQGPEVHGRECAHRGRVPLPRRGRRRPRCRRPGGCRQLVHRDQPGHQDDRGHLGRAAHRQGADLRRSVLVDQQEDRRLPLTTRSPGPGTRSLRRPRSSAAA